MCHWRSMCRDRGPRPDRRQRQPAILRLRRLPSWAWGASCPERSRSRPFTNCSKRADRLWGRFPQTAGICRRRSTLLVRGRGAQPPGWGDSSAIFNTIGGATRCPPSRSPPPTRCSSCCWRRPMQLWRRPGSPSRDSTACALEWSWERCLAARSTMNSRWGCACRKRHFFCRIRCGAGASRRGMSTASHGPTPPGCSSGCRRWLTRRAASPAARSRADSPNRSISWGVAWRSMRGIAPASRRFPPRPTCSARSRATQCCALPGNGLSI